MTSSSLLEGLPPCSLDRRCSLYADGLALDTSHICVLARAAVALALGGSTVAEHFGQLLEAHRCAGQHRLVTSRTLCEDEMDLADPDSIPRRFADLPVDALDAIECLDDQSVNTIEGTPNGLRGRDVTLVHVADACSVGGHVLLVTDDEDLVDATLEMATGLSDAQVAIWPQHSIVFLGGLHRCGALTLDTLIAVADAEETYAIDRWVDDELRHTKMIRIRDTLNEAVLREQPGDE